MSATGVSSASSLQTGARPGQPPAYHLEANGIVEHWHRTLKTVIVTVCQDIQDWCLTCLCVHTPALRGNQERGQSPEHILKIFEKTQYLINTL